MTIAVITTGGTIDKIYHDAASDFQVGDSLLPRILQEAGVEQVESVTEALRKDSLEMTAADRQHVLALVQASNARHILITHGTDTMVDTAQVLAAVADKTIVLTGAMRPARMRDSDAAFNVGFALAAVQLLPPGVWIAMNGRCFRPDEVRKNRAAHRFEAVSPRQTD
ncbi:MAG: asparaginase [Marinobacter sp.]|nr:asparaginase [Marinobacter sp.]